MEKFFIIGNPRSGTSLLRLMLNSHPSIVVPPECGFLQWWYHKYQGWNESHNEISNVSEFVNDLKSSKKIETWKIDFEKVKQEILDQRPSNYEELSALIYVYFGKQRGKTVNMIGDKNNYYIQYLDQLIDTWPTAKVIFMIRDGRDVACSYIAVNKLESASPYKPKLPFLIEEIAKEWKENNEMALAFFSRKPTIPYFIVRYEDLVMNAEKTLKTLCTFLSVDYRAEMLTYYISNQINQDEPSLTLDWKLKTMEKPDPDNIGKFRSILTKEEICRFNEISSNLLGKFNYTV